LDTLRDRAASRADAPIAAAGWGAGHRKYGTIGAARFAADGITAGAEQEPATGPHHAHCIVVSRSTPPTATLDEDQVRRRRLSDPALTASLGDSRVLTHRPPPPLLGNRFADGLQDEARKQSRRVHV
jgi:hypothetical protein